MEHLDKAAEIFQSCGAKLYLDQVIAKKLELQGVSSTDTQTSIDTVVAAVQRERPDIVQDSIAQNYTGDEGCVHVDADQ